jgi:TolA-binding protein
MPAKPVLFALFTIGLITFAPGNLSAESSVDSALENGQKALEEGNTQEALSFLFDAIRQQQELIRQLLEATTSQRDTLHQQEANLNELEKKVGEQETIIEEQKATIAEYEEKLERQSAGAGSPIAAVETVKDIEGMYERAYQTRRTGIFDVRRRDAEPYFHKAIEQFRHIAETYPESRRAPDAQFQAARTYHRWLNDVTEAIQEYQKVVENWPDSPFAEEAREALSELGQPVTP